MIVEQSKQIIAEVNKAFIGKNDIIEKVLMTIYTGGHVLLQDCPGVGKTTLALAFSKVLRLSSRRIQFTPDTLPSDITGFPVFNRETNRFEYRDGAANCQLLLADEINRTSPKTQSALLEVMEERTITVDGETHQLPAPFICIATQNPLGFSGTQPLPESQLDRFMVCLSIGYPTLENQLKIIQAQRYTNPLLELQPGMAETIQYQGDLQLNLERMTNFYFKFCSSHEAYYRLMMAMMYSAKESDTYKAIRPYMSEITAMMTQLFVSAGDRIGNMRGRQEQYSIVFFGLLNSYMLYWFNKSSKDRPALSEHQAYELVHQFLHGIYV